MPLSRSTLIVVEHEMVDAHQRRVVLDVPADLPVFEAHFPNDAILPAYLQTREVVHHSRIAWPGLGTWHGASGIKFKAAIRPGMRLELTLHRDEATTRVRFSIRCEAKTCALGTLRFAAEDIAS